jgi:hypothetical protein
MTPAQRLFVVLGAVTLVILSAIHGAACFGVNLFDHAPWLALVLLPGIFVPFAGFVVALVDALDLRFELQGRGWRTRTKVTLSRLLGLYPRWAAIVLVLAWMYFGVLLVFFADGQAVAHDGRFELISGRNVRRVLTEAEYQHQHARNALVISGCLFVFCLVPLLFNLVGGPEGWLRQPVLHMKRKSRTS